MNRLGVQGYTIRDYMKDKKQFGETLKKLREIGYTCLDHGIPQGMTAGEFKELLSANDFEPLKVDTDVYTLLENPKNSFAMRMNWEWILSWCIRFPRHCVAARRDITNSPKF